LELLIILFINLKDSLVKKTLVKLTLGRPGGSLNYGYFRRRNNNNNNGGGLFG
jgi:hypothetical protein